MTAREKHDILIEMFFTTKNSNDSIDFCGGYCGGGGNNYFISLLQKPTYATANKYLTTFIESYGSRQHLIDYGFSEETVDSLLSF